MRSWIVVALALAACRTHEAPQPPTARPSVAAIVDDASSTPIDSADECPEDVVLPVELVEPAVVECTHPDGVTKQTIEARLRASLETERTKTHTDLELTVGCEQHDGWLVAARFVPEGGVMGDTWTQIWLVPVRGALRKLLATALGPTYDFDHDGTAESSTISTTAVPFGETRFTIDIWFDGGKATRTYTRTITSLVTPMWGSWNGKPLLLFADLDSPRDLARARFSPTETTAVTWSPARMLVDELTAPRALWAASRCVRIPAAPFANVDPPAPAAELGEAVFAKLLPAKGACVRPSAAIIERVEAERRAKIARIASERGASDSPVTFDWGCTSRGETVVASDYVEVGEDERNVTEITAVAADGTHQRLFIARQDPGADGEGAHHLSYSLAGHADFDGDGAAETVIRFVDHEESTIGTDASFAIRVGGVLVPIATRPHPGGILEPKFVRAANTRVDAILFLEGSDASLTSPISWQWESHPPLLYQLEGHGFERAPIATLVAATAAERKKLRERLEAP